MSITLQVFFVEEGNPLINYRTVHISEKALKEKVLKELKSDYMQEAEILDIVINRIEIDEA
jgi:hypothetical protein